MKREKLLKRNRFGSSLSRHGPIQGTVEMAKRMGIEVDVHGFCKTKPFEPTSTWKPVLCLRCVSGTQRYSRNCLPGKRCCGRCRRTDRFGTGTMVTKKEYPPETDVTAEDPRIGSSFATAYQHRRGGQCPEVREYARTLGNVVHVKITFILVPRTPRERLKMPSSSIN